MNLCVLWTLFRICAPKGFWDSHQDRTYVNMAQLCAFRFQYMLVKIQHIVEVHIRHRNIIHACMQIFITVTMPIMYIHHDYMHMLHIYARMHAHINSTIPWNQEEYIPRTYTCNLIFLYYIYIYIYIYIYTHTHTHICADTHVCMNVEPLPMGYYMHTYNHACIQAPVLSIFLMYTYKHTHIHMFTHGCRDPSS